MNTSTSTWRRWSRRRRGERDGKHNRAALAAVRMSAESRVGATRPEGPARVRSRWARLLFAPATIPRCAMRATARGGHSDHVHFWVRGQPATGRPAVGVGGADGAMMAGEGGGQCSQRRNRVGGHGRAAWTSCHHHSSSCGASLTAAFSGRAVHEISGAALLVETGRRRPGEQCQVMSDVLRQDGPIGTGVRKRAALTTTQPTDEGLLAPSRPTIGSGGGRLRAARRCWRRGQATQERGRQLVRGAQTICRVARASVACRRQQVGIVLTALAAMMVDRRPAGSAARAPGSSGSRPARVFEPRRDRRPGCPSRMVGPDHLGHLSGVATVGRSGRAGQRQPGN